MTRSSVRSAFQAVWMVRSRVLRGDLNFWLVVIGYDVKTNSVNSKIYLVYAILFFAVWIFMVLTLLADIAARFLHSLPFATPQAAAVGVGGLAGLALFLFELHRAARRSPFVFSEADAHLLCQTPVDRRPVALIYLIQAWVKRGLGVWAGAVVLGYALLQAQSPRELTPADLPAYMLAGGRMAAVAVPLYLALLALAWAVGAWRLRGARETVNLRWVAPAALLALSGGLALGGPEPVLRWLLPVSWLMQTGLGLASWAGGMAVSTALAVVGVAALWRAANGMSLSRAAQETRDQEAIQAARMTLRVDLLDELVQRQRLQAGHAPSRLPARPGATALVWKNSVQDLRRFSPGDGLPWLAIAGLALGMLAFAGWGARAWGIIFLALLISARMALPLRRNLTRWWLLRQLPFDSAHMLAAMIALPVAGAWLAGLAGLVGAFLLRAAIPWLGVWLFIVLVPSVGLAAIIDILRQSRTDHLLAGRVPDVTFWSLLFALVVIAIDGGFAWLLVVKWGYSAANSFPFIAAESLGLLYMLWKTAGSRLRRVQ